LDPHFTDSIAGGGFNSTTNTYYWTVYNTGVSLAVESLPDDTLPQSSSSTSKTSTPTADPTVTVSVKPVQTTPATTPDSESTSSGKSNNTVGIAVGVVVGIVALAAIIGGAFFYMRRKRSREMDEKNHRDAVINNFFGSKPGSSGGYSASDARLDPVMAHRRDSIGSIADNQDYSRKILRVSHSCLVTALWQQTTNTQLRSQTHEPGPFVTKMHDCRLYLTLFL
jgi:cell wall integrity and stress response component